MATKTDEPRLTFHELDRAAADLDRCYRLLARLEQNDEYRSLSAARKVARATLLAGLEQRGGYFRDRRGEGWMLNEHRDGFYRESFVTGRAHGFAPSWLAHWSEMNRRRFGAKATGPEAPMARAC